MSVQSRDLADIGKDVQRNEYFEFEQYVTGFKTGYSQPRELYEKKQLTGGVIRGHLGAIVGQLSAAWAPHTITGTGKILELYRLIGWAYGKMIGVVEFGLAKEAGNEFINNPSYRAELLQHFKIIRESIDTLGFKIHTGFRARIITASKGAPNSAQRNLILQVEMLFA